MLKYNIVTPLKQCDSDRVSSNHLSDGKQSDAQPSTELKQGYEEKNSKIKRHIIKHPIPPKKTKACE